MAAQSLLGSPEPAAIAALKAVLLISVGVLGLRLGKPRMLGRLAPMDIITLAAMGAAIGRTATAHDTTFGEGAAVVMSLVIVHRLFSALRRFGWFRRLVDRQAQTVVRDGAIVETALTRSGMTVDDLYAALRRQGLTSLDDVALVLHEPTGEITVLHGSTSSAASNTAPERDDEARRE